MDTDWMSRSRCRGMDPESFFPSDGVGVQAASERHRQRLLRRVAPKDPLVEGKASQPDDGAWQSVPLAFLAAVGHG